MTINLTKVMDAIKDQNSTHLYTIKALDSKSLEEILRALTDVQELYYESLDDGSENPNVQDFDRALENFINKIEIHTVL